MNPVAAFLLPLLISARYIGYQGPARDYFLGGTVGVVDKLGTYVLPSIFSKVEYLGHGLYQTTSIDAPDRFSFGKVHAIYNHSGALIKLKIPAECTFERLFWLGKEASTRPDLPLTRLPSDSLLQIRKNDKLGICDVNGAIVVPPEFDHMEQPGDVVALICKGSQLQETCRRGGFVFNVEDHSIKPVNDKLKFRFDEIYANDMHVFSEEGRLGYLGKDGSVAIADKYSAASSFVDGAALVSVERNSRLGGWKHLQVDRGGIENPPDVDRMLSDAPETIAAKKRDQLTTTVAHRLPEKRGFYWVARFKCEPDRTIEHTLPSRYNFDSYLWKVSSVRNVDRTKMFFNFLLDYDLPGMTRREVHDLLGDDDNDLVKAENSNSLCYHLSPGLYSLYGAKLKIDFGDDGKVVRYKVEHLEQPEPEWLKSFRPAGQR